MSLEHLQLFALADSRPFGEAVSRVLGAPLSPMEERAFEDGEHKLRPLVSVRQADVYVIHSLYGDDQESVNDKLCRMLIFLGALRDASAARVTAIVPYLCYARKDQKSKSRDPITTRYIAALFEAVGVDRIVTMDVHNLAAYQNAFRCRSEHLRARNLFVAHFSQRLSQESIAVVSPDVGGVKRAEDFRQALAHATGQSIGSAFMEKYRSAGVVSGETLVGDVSRRTIIILDDLISTGNTIARTARACRTAGADRIIVAATHGLFASGAGDMLTNAELDELVITDTVPPWRLDRASWGKRLTVLDTSSLFAESIRRLHRGGSLVALLGD